VLGVGGRRFSTASSTLHRLWRAAANPLRVFSYLRRRSGYRQAWDHLGADRVSAYAMVDSSRNEEELIRRGHAVAKLLEDALRIDRATSVLEIGCGPARVGRELAPRCQRWIGADVSREMIRRAAARTSHLDNVSFLILEGADLSALADASLDRIYCHSVFVHIDSEDVFRYLREIRRALAPGGLAYVDTWNLLHPEAWEWFSRSVQESPLTGRKDVWRPQFATTPELRLLVEKAGLREVLLLDESHLLQAFLTVPPPTHNVGAWVADLRGQIEDAARAMIGVD
jgi:SAM-dependent methyltransferase